MTTREKLLTFLLGALGIVAAGAIALAANAVSGDSIGLSAQPVSLVSSSPVPKPAPAKRERGDDSSFRPGGEDVVTSDDAGSPNSGPGSSNGDTSGSSGGSGDDRGNKGSGSNGSGSSGTSGSSGGGST